MASKDLVFRLFGEDVNASASIRKLSRSAEESGRGITKAFGNAPRDMTLVAAAAAGASVKMAADFQTATTRLATDAGEQKKNLGVVRQGLLDISAQTGLTAKDTAAGMYLVESAGFHGAAGLKVMQAAAEGAKIGGADVKTVGDALTTTMTDFGKKAGTPAAVMSKLIATVSVGKTTMEDLAGSLHNVLPGAESAGIGLNQVLGAMGTMTAEGISADQASQNLNHSILALSNPTQVQAKAMAAVGLSAFEVAKNLGKKGLTGTYDELTHAITAHMKGGVVVEALFNQSKQAAQSANAELKQLPPSIRGIAESYLNGSITQKEWTNQIKAQTPLNANLLKQFGATAGAAHGFSDAVKSGQGPFATYNAQLSKMTGGQVGLGVALHLSGIHAGAFTDNVKAISGASSEAGGHVKGWEETQQNFNQQLAQAGTAAESLGISFGTLLLPALTHVAIAFAGFFNGLRSGNGGAIALAVTIGIVVAAFVTLYAATKTYELVAGGARVATFLLNGVKRDGVLVTKAQAAADLIGNGVTRAKVIVTKLLTGAYFEQIGAVGKRIGLWIAEKAQIVFATGAMIAQRAAMIVSTAVTWAATAATTAFGVAVDIATGPIGIIILVVAALVVGIILLITHWKDVCAFLQTVWAAVCKWFADTLKLLAAAWKLEWTVIGQVIRTVLNAIGGFFVSWWRTKVLPVINFFVNGWKLATNAASKVPGMIVRVFSSAGSWLFNAGQKIVGGLIDGIRNMIGGAAHAASDVMGAIANFFPHSPAKEGPFSGRGWTPYSGQALVEGFASGITGSTSKVHTAVRGMVTAAANGIHSIAVGAPGAVAAGEAVGLGAADAASEATITAARTGVSGGSGDLIVHVHVQGAVVGTMDELAKTVTTAIRNTVRRGQLPKNVLTAL